MMIRFLVSLLITATLATGAARAEPVARAAQALNDFRASEGLPALTQSDTLQQVAERHAVDMAENGFFIRKINQAFFAFHGTYATSVASISPINGQLKDLRSQSDSLEDFLKTVATFGSYNEFLKYLYGAEGAG
mgnify:CR=1 FL=1